MNYEEFLSEVRMQLTARIEEDATLQVRTMPRNNGTHYDGLVIIRPGRNISPAIYLTPYYHRYLSGVAMEDIYEDILSAYRKRLPEEDFDTGIFTSFEKVRSRLVMRLVHYGRNEELLRDVPHCRFHDLAVTFCCLLRADEENQASILVHNEHMELWKVDRLTLFAEAQANTPILLPPQITPFSELVHGLPVPELSEVCGLEVPMFVATNRSRTNGAAVILYEGQLAAMADFVDADLIILPSSVHEVILLPAEDDSTLEECSHMVREVNETQLADEEILSDHAYYYDRATKEIRC
ncbi:MAG: hypothetical protein J1D89_01360 [Agathobacter sp.]|nr:hypothetical protein [Agathobacter sp.]